MEAAPTQLAREDKPKTSSRDLSDRDNEIYTAFVEQLQRAEELDEETIYYTSKKLVSDKGTDDARNDTDHSIPKSALRSQTLAESHSDHLEAFHEWTKSPEVLLPGISRCMTVQGMYANSMLFPDYQHEEGSEKAVVPPYFHTT